MLFRKNLFLYCLFALIMLGCSDRGVDDQSLSRIAILEDARTLGEGELERFLQHSNTEIRHRAVVAAGRIGDKAIVPALVNLLQDRHHTIQAEVLFALGQIGDSAASSSIIDYLKQADIAGSKTALEALGKIGCSRSRTYLRSVVEANREELLPSAVWGLVRMNDREYRPQIAALLTHKNPEVRLSAAYACYRLADSGFNFDFIPGLTDPDPSVRKYTAGALGKIGNPDKADFLIGLFDDPDLSVRTHTIRATGKCGSLKPVPRLIEFAGTQHYWIYREAIEALGNLKAESACEKLLVMLRTDTGDKIPYLIKALTKIEGERFIPFLDTYSDHPLPKVRRAAGESLGRINNPKAVRLAEDMVLDADPTVRTAVVYNLQHDNNQTRKLVIAALKDEDWAVRTAAAEKLKEWEAANAFKPLLDCYRKYLNKTNPEETRTILRTLFVLDSVEAAPIVNAALKSPQRSVAMTARELLLELGYNPPSIIPPETEQYPTDFGLPMGDVNITIYTQKGRIEVELFGDDAPMVVNNILKLVRSGFYNGVSFHRVVPDFVVQAGDPRGDGWGGPDYTLRDQLNRHKFLQGTMGLATGGLDTGSSQFFICLSPQPHLDGRYTAFGRVVKGFENLFNITENDSIDEVIISVKGENPKYKEM